MKNDNFTNKVFAVLLLVLAFAVGQNAWADIERGVLLGNATDGYYVNMPQSNKKDTWPIIDLQTLLDNGVTSLVVYDDGGKDGDYYDKANGYLILQAPSGYKLKLSGTLWTETGSRSDDLEAFNGNEVVYSNVVFKNLYSTADGVETSFGPYTSSGETVLVTFYSYTTPVFAGFEMMVDLVDAVTNYEISKSNVAGGSITTTVGGELVTKTTMDQVVTVNATPSSGYWLSDINVLIDGSNIAVPAVGADFISNETSFTMPPAAVTVSPTFTDDPASLYVKMPAKGHWTRTIPNNVNSFKVYDDGGADGVYSDNCDGALTLTAPEGKVLKLTGRIRTDYVDGYFYVFNGTKVDKSSEALNDVHYSPQSRDWVDIGTHISSDRSLTFQFKTGNLNYDGLDLMINVISLNSIYNISIDNNLLNGSVVAKVNDVEATSAKLNQTVTLSVTPAENYVVTEVSYNDGSKHIIEPDINGNYSFIMPESDVTVSAVFKSDMETYWGATADGSQGNPYVIKDKAGWDLLASKSETNSFSGIYFRLDADIKGVTTMVGDDMDIPFSGKIDGNGHTVTLNLSRTTMPSGDESLQGLALIHYAGDGLEISNLTVDGTITTNCKFAAGFISYIHAGEANNHRKVIKFTNCRSNVNIKSEVLGDATSAGFVGLSKNYVDMTFENCVFDGSFNAPKAKQLSGFVGYQQARVKTVIERSLFAPQSVDIAADGGNHFTFCRYAKPGTDGKMELKNSYYTTAIGYAQGTPLYKLTLGDGLKVVRTDADTIGNKAAIFYSAENDKSFSIGGVEYFLSGLTVNLGSSAQEIKITNATYTPQGGSAGVAIIDADGTASFTMPAVNTSVYAQYAVGYIDENGTEQTRTDFTLLTSSDVAETYDAGWYVATGDVTIEKGIKFNGDVHLILADGATLNVRKVSDKGVTNIGMNVDGNLSIYGQTLGSGRLNVNGSNNVSTSTNSAKYAYGIYVTGKIAFRGGKVYSSANALRDDEGIVVLYGVYANENITFNHGSVEAICNCDNISRIGRCKSYGISAKGTITLGWSTLDDRFYAPSYLGTVQINDGQFFYYGSNVISGTISDNRTLSGKTLAPYYPMVTFDAQNGSEPTTVLASYDNGDWFVTAPATPTRNGYKFLGWFTSKDGDTKFDFTDPVTQRVTVVYAKWGITYIDENGDEQTITDYTVLANDMSLGDFVKGSWFVVDGKLSFEIPASFTGDAHLILADGAEMTLTKSSGNLLVNDANLSIYGQDAGTGKLKIEVSANETDVGGSVAINGGVVEVSCKNDDGVCSGIAGNVTLNWTRNTNRVKADTYGNSNVTVAEGKFFVDDENKAYSGKLSEEQIAFIAGKVLKPTIPVKYIDADGSEQTLYDYTVLTGCLNTLEEPKKCEETKLASGQWYVVDGIVRYEGELSSAGSIHLVLKDGAKLTVDDDVYVSGEDGLTAEINIYGQSGGMGELITKSLFADYSSNIIFNGGKATIDEGIKVAGKYTMNGGEVTANCAIAKQDVMLLGFGIVGSFITINGGILNSTSCVSDDSGGKLFVAIVGEAAVEINGGTVNLAASSYGIRGSLVSINGGNVSIKNAKNGVSGVNVSIMGGNVVMDGNVDSFSAFPGGDVNPITLGWTNSTDSLKTSGFAGPVTIAEGKYFTDGEGNVYSGEIAYSDENGTVLDGKTLKPCYAVTLDAQNGSDPSTVAASYANGGWFVTAPVAPTRDGFTFLGWFTSKDGDTEFDFNAAVVENTIVYAKWKENVPVEYIDENGKPQILEPGDYTVLTEKTIVGSLGDGWYVVEGEVKYASQVEFSGDAHLILADDATLEIETWNDYGIYASNNLTIYGQSGQRGTLKAATSGRYGIYSNGDITISGGKVTATGDYGIYSNGDITISGGTVTVSAAAGSQNSHGIYSKKGNITISGGTVTASGSNNGIRGSMEVTISGGSVTATGSNRGIYGNNGVTISGGKVTATGENGNGIASGSGDITLGWTNSTDFIYASGYYSKNGVSIAEGKSLKDENGKVYGGKLTDEQIADIKGKTLVPSSFDGKFLSNASIVVADIPVQKYADGKPVCPSVVVTNGKDTLNAGTDYTVTCFNNTTVSSATLDEAAIAQITGKGNYAGAIQKRFFIWNNIGNYAAVQVFEDRDGGTHAEIDGAYDGTDAVAIDEDIAVDTVKFNRNFTVDLEKGGFSTLMLPFSVSTEDVGGLGGVYMFAYVADCDGDKKNDVCISKVWEDSDTKHQTLKAYTPYMVRMKESTLKINKNVTLAKTSGGAVYDQRMQTEKAREGSWQMRGVFGYKKWACNDDELGKVWGYTGEPRDGQKIGKYMKFGKGVWINPFRAYLFDPNGEQLKCTDESNTDGSKPQPIAVSPYAKAYTADFLPASAKSAANATASSEMASLDEFGGMEVVLIDDESDKSIAGGKGTTAVGRKSSAATKPSMQPRTKQTYDLKGRRVGNSKKAKGAYYNRR